MSNKQAYATDIPYPSIIVGGSILSSISKLIKQKGVKNTKIIHIIFSFKTYYIDLVCPIGNVTTNGNHTPLNKNPGCGDTPGPTGKPPIIAGGVN